MPLTRKQASQKKDQNDFELHYIEKELKRLENNMNIEIIKNLRSITRRVHVYAKVSISHELYIHLQRKYHLTFKLKPNSDFVFDLRIIHAFPKNRKDISAIDRDTLFVAIRQSRPVFYKSFENGKLKTNEIRQEPYCVISFIRNDKVLQLN